MKMKILLSVTIGICAVCISCSQQSAVEPQQTGSSSFTITSTAFTANGEIPKAYTCSGKDISPALQWTDPPAGTKSFAIVMEDPDAQPVVGYTWIHWVAYNIPPSTRGLKEGLPKTAALTPAEGAVMLQGVTSFKSPGYGGPCPPEGTGVHHYHFTLYALSIPPELPEGMTKKMLLASIRGKITGEAKLTGTYGKK